MPRGFAAVTEGAWLPLVPVPFLDESFGSWLRRCAEGYVTTEYEFASAVLALDHKAPPAKTCDWASVAIPPTDLTDHPIPWLDRIGVSGWFDPAMLQSVVGRDLMIYMASAAASGLFSKLFDHGRFWKDLWHDGDRKPHCWPEFIHPIGPIRPRRTYTAKSVLLMTRRNKSSESEMLSISMVCNLSPV